jgi:hypothetical protein
VKIYEASYLSTTVMRRTIYHVESLKLHEELGIKGFVGRATNLSRYY